MSVNVVLRKAQMHAILAFWRSEALNLRERRPPQRGNARHFRIKTQSSHSCGPKPRIHVNVALRSMEMRAILAFWRPEAANPRERRPL